MVQSKQTIQVQIGGRTYPITVEAEEQEHVLKAAEKVNLQLKEFESAYKIKDQQDLLAMSCLQLATEHLKNHRQLGAAADDANENLEQLNGILTDYLNKL